MDAMTRLNSGQWGKLEAGDKTIEDALTVLYHSEHFIAVNKRFDLKVNSDDAADAITVATLLAHQFPTLVDKHAAHGFRY